MNKTFIKCPHCGYEEKEEARPCSKTDCINYEEMKMECTMCKDNKSTSSSISFYKKGG